MYKGPETTRRQWSEVSKSAVGEEIPLFDNFLFFSESLRAHVICC